MVILRRSMGTNTKEQKRHNTIQGENSLPYFSVDIGTTTVAMELYDAQGNWLDAVAEDNAQLALGSDVMMRLMHVREGWGDQLTSQIRRQLYAMGKRMLAEHRGLFGEGAVPETIAIVGNTVMCHLLLGKDTVGLMGAPFEPAYRGNYRTEGGQLGWEDWRHTSVLVLAGIAAHVGADALSVAGQLELWDDDKVQMAVDLGTNAEILLNVCGNLYACSTAAGPAFEGKGISCGKRAGIGVINGVKCMRGNESFILDVIADTDNPPAPIGICGSGLVDVVAELLQNRLLRADGYLLSKEEAAETTFAKRFAKQLCQREDGTNEFLIYHEAGTRIALTQEDIRAFQLAKGAIRSGMEMLLHKQGLSVAEVDELHIAGVFGGFLHPENARKTGLLPDIPAERLFFDGNAAGRGAAKLLRRPELADEWAERARSITHVELAQEEQFTQVYMKAMELCTWGNLC